MHLLQTHNIDLDYTFYTDKEDAQVKFLKKLDNFLDKSFEANLKLKLTFTYSFNPKEILPLILEGSIRKRIEVLEFKKTASVEHCFDNFSDFDRYNLETLLTLKLRNLKRLIISKKLFTLLFYDTNVSKFPDSCVITIIT
jgi:hypothetical protein